MTDVKADIKAAILEILGDLVQPKAAAGGATGFGPLRSDAGDVVHIQGGEGQKLAWYRWNDAEKERYYIEDEAFTGQVINLNTRDHSGDRGATRKIDLTMRDSNGCQVTFVLGMFSKVSQPDFTQGAKSLLSALASCLDSQAEIVISPKLGSKNSSVVLMTVLVNGIGNFSSKIDNEQAQASLDAAWGMFGGTHIPLKGEEQQPQTQRVAPPAAPAKAAAPAKKERVARATDQEWTNLKTYLGDDPETVENTKELIVAWCKDLYNLKSPVTIPAGDQAAALYECKQHLDQWADAQQSQASPVPDEDWTDDVPF